MKIKRQRTHPSNTVDHPSTNNAVWAKEAEALLAVLDADVDLGLTDLQVRQRRADFGENVLRSVAPRRLSSLIVDQFSSIVVLLLVCAALIAALIGEYVEATAILVVIVINATLGFLMEWRAVRSMEALRRMGHLASKVRRSGRAVSVPAEELVPGDILLLEPGDIITADARLLQTAELEVDQSTLTGESLPVKKHSDILEPSTALADRSNLIHKGTAVTTGSGVGVITATGTATELGKIAQLIASEDTQETPLEKRLDALGRRLVWLVLVLGIFLTVAGILAGREWALSLEIAIALAVAAIPEGLPVVATIALARGMHRMARRHALIRRLSAVETLGATGVVLTDKTGTLTENKMTLTELRMPHANLLADALVVNPDQSLYLSKLSASQIDPVAELLLISTLCNNATLTAQAQGSLEPSGDPTEVALFAAAMNGGIDRERALAAMPRIKEVPFTSKTMAMATLHQLSDELLVAVKGSPEAILECCTSIRSASGAETLTDSGRTHWLEQARQLGDAGFRTLAIATKRTQNTEDDPYQALTFLGIAGLEDPPRAGIAEVLERCRKAGIRVVMVTGDHPATAHHIAQAVGLMEATDSSEQVIDGRTLSDHWSPADIERLLTAKVIARATPDQKYKLIVAYQAHNHVVAMTGDGVNDAPALKQADIGVAMGLRGTEVAKDASDMVLLDDNLETIVAAVAHGRSTYGNIRKFVVYLLSCNLAEILIVALATLAGAPLPLLPLQILFLNLVTDVFPALALGMGRGSPLEMTMPPRPAHEALMSHRHWMQTTLYGVVMAFTVLAAMAYATFVLKFDHPSAVAVSFCTLACAQLGHVFNMRHARSSMLHNDITANPWIWSALALCLMLIVAAVYLPALAIPLRLSDPGRAGWLLIAICSPIPILLGIPIRWGFSRRNAAAERHS